MELFTYPVDDPELLMLRRLETEALRRAFAVSAIDQRLCWTRAALEVRRARFELLPEGSVTYERHSELNEGLATYIELRAAEEEDRFMIPAGEFDPESIRERSYRTGAAFARLLDQVDPAWKIALEQNSTASLDALLASALSRSEREAAVCEFTAAERDQIRAGSTESVNSLQMRRAERRAAFVNRPGWVLVIAALDAPFFPQGFDPLNVQKLTRGEMLHTRYLKLGNQSGEIEVLGRASLTEASGEHPLFNGVRLLTITGFDEEPVITENDGVVTIDGNGMTAELRGATVERSGQTVMVRMQVRGPGAF